MIETSTPPDLTKIQRKKGIKRGAYVQVMEAEHATWYGQVERVKETEYIVRVGGTDRQVAVPEPLVDLHPVFKSVSEHGKKKDGRRLRYVVDPEDTTGVANLRKIYPEEDNKDLYKTGMIDKLEAIQKFLKDAGKVDTHFEALEAAAKVYLATGVALRPTQALNLALHAQEKTWMVDDFYDLRESAKPEIKKATEKPKKPEKPNKDRTKVEQGKDARAFLKEFNGGVVQKVVPFKDVGAPLPHGEYAHRIQWYMISRAFIPLWSVEDLQALHKEAGDKSYFRELNTPKRPDDKFRALWDYVVDIRQEEAKEVVEDSDEVYAASPVRITSGLLGFSGGAKGKPGDLVKHFPVIAKAVANRRRKRAVEREIAAIELKLEKKEMDEVQAAENLDRLRAEFDPAKGWEKRDEWLATKWPESFH